MANIIGALFVGLVLGLLGSGGSTIMVPILVYVVGHDAKISIAESMAIVGAISIIGAIPYGRAKQIDWRSVWLFGLPAMLGTFIGAWLGGLSTDAVQLVVFGVVLISAAIFMIRNAFGRIVATDPDTAYSPSPLTASRTTAILIEGIVVGTITGFVGVGGGFLIVPALLIFGKLPMRLAIGTSLIIIAMKSAIGFAKYQHYLTEHGLSVDWPTIILFIAVGLGGCFVGQRLNTSLNQRVLKQVFAVFLILIGALVIVKEGGKLFESPDAESSKDSITHSVPYASPTIRPFISPKENR